MSEGGRGRAKGEPRKRRRSSSSSSKKIQNERDDLTWGGYANSLDPFWQHWKKILTVQPPPSCSNNNGWFTGEISLRVLLSVFFRKRIFDRLQQNGKRLVCFFWGREEKALVIRLAPGGCHKKWIKTDGNCLISLYSLYIKPVSTLEFMIPIKSAPKAITSASLLNTVTYFFDFTFMYLLRTKIKQQIAVIFFFDSTFMYLLKTKIKAIDASFFKSSN